MDVGCERGMECRINRLHADSIFYLTPTDHYLSLILVPQTYSTRQPFLIQWIASDSSFFLRTKWHRECCVVACRRNRMNNVFSVSLRIIGKIQNPLWKEIAAEYIQGPSRDFAHREVKTGFFFNEAFFMTLMKTLWDLCLDILKPCTRKPEKVSLVLVTFIGLATQVPFKIGAISERIIYSK